MLKTIVKKILPDIIINKVKLYVARVKLYPAYNYDLKRYWRYSGTTRRKDTQSKLLGAIIMDYHVIEKGLTMPKTRLGFGYERLERLIENCGIYIEKFDLNNFQFKNAIGVILEYKNYHEENNYQLKESILNAIKKIENRLPKIEITKQLRFTKEEYFKFSKSNFLNFSNSRHSVRNFSKEEIPLNKLLKALELTKNTPSACNRQTSSLYVYTNKERINKILEVQGGNRGFGHLVDKLIVLTADLSVFSYDYERNQAYIDGGIYAMNLLYALHYYEIACCILNCDHTVKKDMIMRKLCGIKEEEIFIAIFACGNLPENFLAASSARTPIQEKVIIHEK